MKIKKFPVYVGAKIVGETSMSEAKAATLEDGEIVLVKDAQPGLPADTKLVFHAAEEKFTAIETKTEIPMSNGPTQKFTTTIDITLTAEDEASIEALGLDRDKFIAMRRAEVERQTAFGASNATVPAAPPAPIEVQLTAEDLAACKRLQLDPKAFAEARRGEIERKAEAAR